MNKRIEELANRAGFEKGDYNMYWDQDGNSEGVDLEKFAKLIIEECCEIIYENEYMTPNQCAWKIESHFGV